MNAPTPSWNDLVGLLPAELRPYALPFAWDPRRLWALDLPTEELPRADLDWQLDLRWWRAGDRFFVVRPRDVLADPVTYSDHYGRALMADLRFPLDLTLRSGRWFILDGVHRLLKATILARPIVLVRRVPTSLLGQIAEDVVPPRAA
jgi:hypothetical protein